MFPKVCYKCHAVNEHHAAFCTNPPVKINAKESKRETKLIGMIRSNNNTYLTALSEVTNPNTGESTVLPENPLFFESSSIMVLVVLISRAVPLIISS